MSLASKIYPSGSGSLPLRTAPSSPPASPGGGLAMKVAGSRPFAAPVQNKLGTMEFTNLQPRGPAAPAAPPSPASPTLGGLAAKVAGAGGMQTTNGFTSFADEQLGAAGWQKSGGDRKAGWVAQSGSYKGQTRPEAEAKLRAQYAAMTPEQKAAYEARANNADIGDQGAAPGAPPIGTPMDTPSLLSGSRLTPSGLGGVDKVEGSLTRRARMGGPKTMMA